MRLDVCGLCLVCLCLNAAPGLAQDETDRSREAALFGTTDDETSRDEVLW